MNALLESLKAVGWRISRSPSPLPFPLGRGRAVFPFILLSGALALWSAGCGKSDKNATAGTNASSSNPLNAPADYLRGLNKAEQSAVKTVDTARIDQAISLFNVDKGRNPKDLNELVKEKFLSEIPPVPYGMKLQYDEQSGKVSVVKQ